MQVQRISGQTILNNNKMAKNNRNIAFGLNSDAIIIKAENAIDYASGNPLITLEEITKLKDKIALTANGSIQEVKLMIQPKAPFYPSEVVSVSSRKGKEAQIVVLEVPKEDSPFKTIMHNLGLILN